MGKQLNIYRAFTSAQLKSRASIPSAVNIVDNTTYITCSNISLAAVRNLLGASTYSLYDICRHANVKVWSGFGPTKRYVSGGVLTNRVPNNSEGYSLGSFAGYNHAAVTPHYESVTHDDNQDVNAGSDASFSVQCYLGEPILTGTDIIGVSDTDRALVLAVWEGATLRATHIHDINADASYLTHDHLIIELLTTYTIPVGQTCAINFTCRIYLANNLTGFASDLSNVICKFNEFADYTKKIIVRKPNFVYIEAPENNGGVGSYDGGTLTWTFGKWVLSQFSWSPSTGVLSFQRLSLNENLSGGYSNLSLSVYVERGYIDTDGITWVTEDTYSVPAGVNPIYNAGWNTAVTPPTLPPDAVDGATLFPSGVDIIDEAITNTGYGYRIVFDCNVS